MDFSVRGAGIVEVRPFGVLFRTGRLGGGGLSRGSWSWWRMVFPLWLRKKVAICWRSCCIDLCIGSDSDERKS